MSIYETKKLQEERGSVAKQMQDLVAQAGQEKRDLTPEELTKFDQLDNAEKEINAKIEQAKRFERAQQLRDELQSVERTNVKAYRPAEVATYEDHDKALRAWGCHGTQAQRSEFIESARKVGLDPSATLLHFNLRGTAPKSLREIYQETRGSSGVAQSVGTAAAGGDTVPREMANAVEAALLSFGGMREAARVIRTASGATFDIPTSNDTSEYGQILNENTAEEVQSVAFAKVSLGAHKYSSKLLKVSTELLQDANFDIASFLGEQLGNRIARKTNQHFTIGSTSSANPFGVVTEATSGADSVSKDAISYNELLDLLHSVDPAYRRSPSCRWMFNDGTLKVLRQLTDTQGRPLWQAGLSDSQPASLLGYPYVINNEMPAMGTVSNRPIIFGDMSQYWIRDVRDVVLQRLNERYAEYAQVAFLALSRHDGKTVNAGTNPIKALILGSST